MAQLARQIVTNANLSAEAVVLTYPYLGTTPKELSARVLLGDGTKNLSGAGGNYIFKVYLNGIVISPFSIVPVASGLVQTVGSSRSFQVDSGDVVTVTVTGQSGDTAVTTTTELRDSTPIGLSDVLGPGVVRIDHNYGGTNALQVVTLGGVGIPNATIWFYLTSDWTAGNTAQAFIQARTTTVNGGFWANPVYLSPNTYTMAAFREPDYSETLTTLVVS